MYVGVVLLGDLLVAGEGGGVGAVLEDGGSGGFGERRRADLGAELGEERSLGGEDEDSPQSRCGAECAA